MAKYQLECGPRLKALRVCIYGQPGIGKTTLGAQFPNPVFIDVEDGSNQLNVARLPRPTSWTMFIDELNEVRLGNVPCSSIIIDTADAAEQLCTAHVCADNNWKGIEDAGWGKGYTYLSETFAKMLDLCGAIVDGGRNVVFISHSWARKFERPDEEGAYDRYELKLSKRTAPMLKEWSDMLLFLDYKTIVETESSRDGKVTKAKAKGGRRIIRTTHHVCWDAKNRFGLPDELPLEYASIAKCIPDMLNGGLDANLRPAQPMQPTPTAPVQPVQDIGTGLMSHDPQPQQYARKSAPQVPQSVPQMPIPQPPAQAPQQPSTTPIMQEVDARLASMQADVAKIHEQQAAPQQPAQTPTEDDPRRSYKSQALIDVMLANDVTDTELRSVVAQVGTRPFECEVNSYPDGFIDFLVANFAGKVMPQVMAQRQA